MSSDIFKRFKHLQVIDRLMTEMDSALQIRDKVLAEFVLDLAKKCKTVMQFETLLEQNGADFSIELISTIFALITKMLPEFFERKTNFRLAEQIVEPKYEPEKVVKK